MRSNLILVIVLLFGLSLHASHQRWMVGGVAVAAVSAVGIGLTSVLAKAEDYWKIVPWFMGGALAGALTSIVSVCVSRHQDVFDDLSYDDISSRRSTSIVDT